MKRILIAVLTVAALSVTSMGFAANAPAAGGKNECLLSSKNCMDQVDSIQQRMKKLHAEIKKGKKVYSAEELKTLEQKLKETDDYLKSLEKPGK